MAAIRVGDYQSSQSTAITEERVFEFGCIISVWWISKVANSASLYGDSELDREPPSWPLRVGDCQSSQSTATTEERIFEFGCILR